MDRVGLFRAQRAAWTGPGVPFFRVPGTDERDGSCVSCGGLREAPGLRCAECRDAVVAVLFEENEAAIWSATPAMIANRETWIPIPR